MGRGLLYADVCVVYYCFINTLTVLLPILTTPTEPDRRDVFSNATSVYQDRNKPILCLWHLRRLVEQSCRSTSRGILGWMQPVHEA